MLNVRRLRLLRDLAQHGTIAGVAAAHTYTPSAVSQQLAALEREAGVALLERTGRRVALTPAGRTLVTHAEEVLAALERATAALAAGRDGLSGPLRIGAFPTAMRTLLPPALVALGEAHPALELSVQELDPAVVPHLLRDGTLDVALVHDYDLVPIEPDPALRTLPLLDETIFVAARAPLSLADCRDEPWILASRGTLCHTMTVRACEAAGFIPRVRHFADDFVTVLTFVAAGQGVALVPELATMEAAPGRSLDSAPGRSRETAPGRTRETAGETAAETAGTAEGTETAESTETAETGGETAGEAATDGPGHRYPGVVLTPLETRRRTRLAFRAGAAQHPAVAAFATALGIPTTTTP